MARVRKTVSLHESTVKKVAIEGTPSAKRAARRKSRRPRNTVVQVRIWSDGVNELIVDWVNKQGIDYRLIEIRSENEIVIRNNTEE